jgi:type IV pilus assembly protein PilC
MSTFAFRAVDVAGVPSRGELEAPSKAQVTEQLRAKGLIVLDVAERHEAFKIESIWQRFKSVDHRNLSVFSRQFATLVGSGMPLLRSLYTLEDQTEDEMLKPAIASVRSDVEAGSSLHQAMERQPGVFDPLYRSMVRSGEESGKLEDFSIALLVMLAICAFVVPVFVSIFKELAAENPTVDSSLPAMTQITVTISNLVTKQFYILIPVVAVLAYGFVRWKKTERGRAAWDAFKLRFPKIGDVVRKVALARWSRTFSGAIASGVPILQAIEISGITAGNVVVTEAMDDVYASVKRGGSIAKPLAEHPVFPPMVSHMVAVGEDSGQLEVMLAKIADFYETEVDAKVKALTSLIEPLMIVVVGAMVGFIVISMYLPIFSIYNNIR